MIMRQPTTAIGSRQTTPSLPSGALVTFPFWYIIIFSMRGPPLDQFITSHHGCSCSCTEHPSQPWLPGNLTVRRAAGNTVGDRRLYALAFKRSTFTLPQRSTPACVRHEVAVMVDQLMQALARRPVAVSRFHDVLFSFPNFPFPFPGDRRP